MNIDIMRRNIKEKKLQGTVCKGRGLGSGFVDGLHREDPILELLEGKPYKGTLCVRLSKLCSFRGISYGTTGRGKVYLFRIYLENLPVVAKWSEELPLTLQLISTVNLRENFYLNDGASIKLIVNSHNLRRISARVMVLASLQSLRDCRLLNRSG